MSHIFFIHLSVDGHLSCFHVLATVNSAAVNRGVHVSFPTKALSEYMGLLDLFFFFLQRREFCVENLWCYLCIIHLPV